MLIKGEVENPQNNNINQEYEENEVDLEGGLIDIPSTLTEKHVVNSPQTLSQKDTNEFQPSNTKKLEQIPQNDANKFQPSNTENLRKDKSMTLPVDHNRIQGFHVPWKSKGPGNKYYHTILLAVVMLREFASFYNRIGTSTSK
jgi:hypothetical protein